MTTETDEMLTPALIRAARGLLGLDQAEVAERAGLKQRTISKLEGETDFSLKDLRRRKALKAIRDAFEKAGIEFMFPSETSGEGVRKKSPG
ncbi:MAG: helix-turn-helix domain-containing protein [Bradyrhizobium sp.]|jgi:transcriptional regulator with XRE-family HTH domain|uniref:helix-turn-helix domain-containing protein n=1 Tax=Bradyrhizobium TaxID=374 RepID=UPI0009B7860C|nr:MULTISPECIES: helix-turn-helix transcriptional regulator [Bradyrhizobium]